MHADRSNHEFPPQLANIVNEQPYPLLFVTISGAHLYGLGRPAAVVGYHLSENS
jgi:hypothetical protein